MNQHINSMLEHLSSLRRKNSESSQAASNDKQAVGDHKDVNDIDTVNSKSRNNIFKNLISDNGGATNILHNLIKCPENISSHLSTAMSSSSNGSCKPKANNHEDDDNNNQQAANVATIVQPCVNEGIPNHHKKRNSTVKMLQSANGDLNILQRELSPSPRAHRKSSHDIRLLRNNQTILEGGELSEVGKLTGVKPLKTKNIITKNETFDTLHCRAMDVSMQETYDNKLHLIPLIMHQQLCSLLLNLTEKVFNLINREDCDVKFCTSTSFGFDATIDLQRGVLYHFIIKDLAINFSKKLESTFFFN